MNERLHRLLRRLERFRNLGVGEALDRAEPERHALAIGELLELQLDPLPEPPRVSDVVGLRQGGYERLRALVLPLRARVGAAAARPTQLVEGQIGRDSIEPG